MKKKTSRLFLFVLFAGLFTVVGGCATTYRAPDETLQPRIDVSAPRQRAYEQISGKVSVRVAALGAAESEAHFGLPLSRDGIQPVWIEIENRDQERYFFSPLVLDPEYFSPFELAWKYRNHDTGLAFNDLGLLFTRSQVEFWIPPGSTVSGFVFTRQNQGVKAIRVDLAGEHSLKRFDFVVRVPGLRADYLSVDWEGLYDESEIVDLDEAALRQMLQTLPCCALGGDRETPGDPLNIVVIGDGAEALNAFILRGWEVTETIHGAAVWRTIASSLFGRMYRHSPVSPLYVFDRQQDIALQKARQTVDERNHLRIWLSPYDFEGRNVWIGQISRDIGVRFSSKTFVTHKIDPDVNETRDYLVQDLVGSGYARRLGYGAGVGAASIYAPRFNYTDDPYWTDGHRAVIELANSPIPLETIDVFKWDWPE